MRLLKYISMVAAVLLLAGCSDEPFDGPDGPKDEGDMLSLRLSVNIGEMMTTNTRAFTDQPDYASLHLYVIEFDDNGAPLDGNTLTNVYEALNERVNADGDIHFDLRVYKSDHPKVLHLIAVPDGTELPLNYGLEGQVIPALTVGNDTPAYWARVLLPDGYGSEKKVDGTLQWVTASDVQGAITHVPMLRNFAKVTMSSSAPASDGFDFRGFVVLNRAGQGTIAPWDAAGQVFPDFHTGKGEDAQPKAYSAMTYSGYCPVGPDGIIAKDTPAEDAFTTDAKYLYERPASSIDNTVVIFRGERQGRMRYYKLDLGTTDEQTMIFKYYNVLRNFDYHINLTGVTGNGYDTPEEAMRGVTQNNFSFDVTTAQMLNISNGTQMLWVNQTTFVVNDANRREITFKYRFMPDVSKQGQYNNSQLKFYTENADGSTTPEIQKGSVITSVSAPSAPDAEGYSSITLTTSAPTDESQTARFIVIDPTSGLARTINVIVRNPWEYSLEQAWAGTYNTPEQFNSTDYPRNASWQNAVDIAQGADFTLIFELEENIPQAMFPLQFVAEAEQQNIENNKIGTLVVRSDDSFFSTDKKTAIQYVKTVTWADYNSRLTLANPTGTIVTENGEDKHRIRMRFLTIRQQTAGTVTDIRVHNPYFKNSAGGDYCTFTVTAQSFNPKPWSWTMTSNEQP